MFGTRGSEWRWTLSGGIQSIFFHGGQHGTWIKMQDYLVGHLHPSLSSSSDLPYPWTGHFTTLVLGDVVETVFKEHRSSSD